MVMGSAAKRCTKVPGKSCLVPGECSSKEASLTWLRQSDEKNKRKFRNGPFVDWQPVALSSICAPLLPIPPPSLITCHLLLPFITLSESARSDAGYIPQDLYCLDSEYGSEQELRALLRQLKEAHICASGRPGGQPPGRQHAGRPRAVDADNRAAAPVGRVRRHQRHRGKGKGGRGGRGEVLGVCIRGVGGRWEQ